MRKLITALLIITVLFSACSSSKKINSSNSVESPADARDGSSYEKAIIIVANSETSGVHKEYEWLRKNYPGYTFNGQSLDHHNKKPYDIINIVTSDGKNKAVYFDITKFFGKF